MWPTGAKLRIDEKTANSEQVCVSRQAKTTAGTNWQGWNGLRLRELRPKKDSGSARWRNNKYEKRAAARIALT